MPIDFMDERVLCPQYNIRSPSFYIASRSVQCPSCGKQTGLAAVAVPAGHERFDEDASLWVMADYPALLFEFNNPDAKLLQEIRGEAAGFGEVTGHAGFRGDPAQWANHCAHCALRFDEQELHCEPRQGFVATRPECARDISLRQIDEPLKLNVSGYTLAPEFFDQFTRR